MKNKKNTNLHDKSIDEIIQLLNPLNFYTKELRQLTEIKNRPYCAAEFCPFCWSLGLSFFIHKKTGGYCCIICQQKGNNIYEYMISLPIKNSNQEPKEFLIEQYIQNREIVESQIEIVNIH